MIITTLFLYEHTTYFILLALVLQEFFFQYLVINSKVYSYSAKEKRNYSYLINQCLSF